MTSPIGTAYSFGGFRAQRVFAETLTAAMFDSGLTPDTFLKEYGVDQYEVTYGPRPGILGADHALILRELVRITGEHLDRPVSFTPLRAADGGRGFCQIPLLLTKGVLFVCWIPLLFQISAR